MTAEQQFDQDDRPNKSDDLKTIGEVAEIVELTPRAIRYYEELGLLTPEVRVKGVPRLFNSHDVQRLREIKRLREIAGFTLADLSELLDNEDVRAQLRNRFQHTEDRDERIAVLRHAIHLAERRLSIVEHKLEQLDDVRRAELAHIDLIKSLLQEQGVETTDEGKGDHADGE